MYCEACGTQLQPGQQFCSTCGRVVSSGLPDADRGGRLRRHVHLLGILWLVLSGLQLLGGLLLIAAARAFLLLLQPGAHVGPLFLRPLFAILALLILGKGLLGVAAGISLLKRAAWGRALALFLAYLSLFEVPFGTALAIYTMWVLLSSDADRQYRTLAAAG